jgi:hypothetical protein
MLLMIFVISFLNIWLAKRKMLEWKRFSTWHFLGPMLSRVTAYDTSAASWMDRFGYMEADARRLANFQTIANFEGLICLCIWIVVVALLTSK